MKTLKKTLCLVLAVVMAVGVLILPANADMKTYQGFQDTGEIDPNYEVAVATLTGMGIISGKSDTAFVPSAPVTRAEAASLIVATLTTPAGRALAVLGSEHPFTDVSEAHKWADGNIGYAYEAGIVSGKTDTTFAPDATVTGYELLTMLMKATGYEPKNTSANWQAKAVEFAREYGIFAVGLKDVVENPNKALTREETAQMIWQAINHSPDGTVSESYIVYLDNNSNGKRDSGDKDIGEPVDSLIEALLVMQTYSNSNTETKPLNYSKVTVNTGSIGATLYHLEKNEDFDTFGRSTYGYKDGSKEKNNLYSSLTVPADLIYTDGVDLNDALKALGYEKDDEVSVYYTTNGEAEEAATTFKVGTSEKEFKAGQRVEVYYVDDGVVQVIVIDTYVHKLKDGEVKKATSKEKAKVVIEDAEGNTYTKETSEFAKDQIVIYTAVKTKEKQYTIVDMSVANTISGKITASGSNYIRVDNEKKLVSANAVDSAENPAKVGESAGYMWSGTTEYNLYLDSYGHVIYATTEKEETVATNYIYVVKSAVQEYNAGKPGDELLGTGTTEYKDAIAKARVIDPETGEIKVVDVAFGKSADGKHYYFKDKRGSLDTAREVTEENAPTVGFHKYAILADGTYAILPANDEKDPVTVVKNVDVDKGKADIATGYFANASTKLLVTTYKDDVATSTSFSSYNGYGSFPEATINNVAVVAKDGVVSKIYVVQQSAITAEAEKVNYAVYKGKGETTDKEHLEFYVNGEVVTYVDETKQNLKENTVYNLKVTNGVVVAEEIENPKAEKITIVENEYIVAGGKLAYLTANTVIVDATNGYAVVDSVAVNKEAMIFTTTSGGNTYAMFIVITK